MNIFEGLKKYSSLKKGEVDFVVCSRDGKYGLLNKYLYLCLPYEYDNIELEYGQSLSKGVCRTTLFAKMEKNGTKYTAIIDGDAVCNVLTCQPKSLLLCRQFLIIEEEFTKDGNKYSRQGLLNRGGIRILESEYDSIKIVSDHFAIVSKDNLMELYYICQTNSERKIGPSKEIKYGEGYREDNEEMYYYATDVEYDIVILGIEGNDGFRKIDNWIFGPDDLDSDEDLRPRGYDKIYFSYHGKPNNYFAVVVDNKTELIDFNGNQIIPFVIPSDCHVETDTYSEGIVGVSKIKQEENSEGNTYEKTYYSFVNTKGKLLSNFIYEEITKFKNGQAKAYFSIYGKTSYGYCEQIIDKNGNILSDNTDWDSDGPNTDWVDMIDDAFEGDPEAYWNID